MCDKFHGLDEESMNNFAYLCLAFDASSGLKKGIKMKIMNLFLLSIRRFLIFFVVPRARETIGRKPKSLLARRIELFFDIIRNERMFRRFGYCSMGRFLFGSIWTHFFDKRIEGV